jgi:aminoglycoside phosphotransferase (APT) family kinase protein
VSAPTRQELEPELFGWALTALRPAPGEHGVQRVGLREGGSPWRIELDDGTGAVLRVAPAAERQHLETELAALELAGRHGLPVPRVIAADLDGAVVEGRLAVLMSLLPGSSRSHGAAPSQDRFRALGVLAATIAAVPAPRPSAALPVRARPIPSLDFVALRRAEPVRPLLAAAEETLAELPVPDRPAVFVHGDLWQGNTLWSGGADGATLTGVVDWDCAGVGPAGIDLGSLRCDAAMTSGREAADAVLAGYEETVGRPADDVAHWDVVAALATPPAIGWFTDAIRDQGRSDLDQPTLLHRRDAFLRAALARLG